MRRTKLLACIALLWWMSLGLNAQNITLKLNNVSAKDAIAAVSQETGYSIVVKTSPMDLEKKVSVNVTNASMSDVINQIFAGQGVIWSINGKTVAVEKKSEQTRPASTSQAQKCSGTVTDAAGEPLAGVVVIVKGSNTSAITDLDGNFSITANLGSPLLISCLGYQATEISALPVISVSLKDSVEYLDEAVAVGYGTMKKKDLTGAISHVNALEVQATAPRAVTDVLRGRVAGLHLWQGTDVSGNTNTIKVRAQNSLSGASDALIILDGAVFTGLLADINPADIESIDVMKDASSAAVYGSNAATGVILITTRKGETGKPKINFSSNVGLAHNWSRSEFLDGESFLNLRKEVAYSKLSESDMVKKKGMYDNPYALTDISQLDWYNIGRFIKAKTIPEGTDLTTMWLTRLGLTEREIECYKNGIETDWGSYLFPKAALQQQYQVSISNRNDKCSFFTSAGYTDKEGTQAGMGYRALSARVNIDAYITKWLTIGTNTMLTLRDNSQTQTSDTRLNLSPYTTNDIDDPESPYFRYTTGTSITNPFLAAKYMDKDGKDILINSNVFAKISLPWGFEFKSTFTPTLFYQRLYTHQSSENPQWVESNIIAKREHTEGFNWQIDNVLSWSKTFGDHRTEATFIQNAEQRLSWYTRAYGWDFNPDDQLSYHGLYSAQSTSVGSNDTYQTADALIGRLFYQFKGRYMINASVRRDGYSEFGANYKRGTFPAVGVAWTFTEEPFAKGSKWLNYGKLRASWGINGHRNIQVGDGAAKISTNTNYTRINSEGKAETLSGSLIEASNTDLRWEKTESYNLGLDFGMFKSLIDGSVEFYVANTTDLIAQRTMPTINGYGGTWDLVKANVGNLRNHGFELTLNIHPIRNENLKWDSTIMFETYRRKLLSLGYGTEYIYDEDGNVIGEKEADDVTNGWYVGHDPDEVRDYVQNGVWQVDEAEEAAVYGCKPGDFKYVDQNGDRVLNDDDKVFMGWSFSSRYNISWQNNFTMWKNLSLSFLLYANLYQFGEFNQAANQVSSNYNWYDQPIWTVDNPTDDYARLNSINLGNHWLRRDFVRVDNITLSYWIPQRLLKKLSIKSANLSLTARNPFLFTKWPMGDPENYRNYGYGLKTYTMGLNISL